LSAGFNVEKVQYKNVAFTVWDVGGQEKLRSLWKMYLSNSDALVIIRHISKYSISFFHFSSALIPTTLNPCFISCAPIAAPFYFKS
jgi:UV DNA damage repair endonuclease